MALVNLSSSHLSARVPTLIGDNSETAGKVAALGSKFTGITADFGNLDQAMAKDIIAQIIAAAGRVDVLVNNAGIIKRNPAVDCHEEDGKC